MSPAVQHNAALFLCGETPHFRKVVSIDEDSVSRLHLQQYSVRSKAKCKVQMRYGMQQKRHNTVHTSCRWPSLLVIVLDFPHEMSTPFSFFNGYLKILGKRGLISILEKTKRRNKINQNQGTGRQVERQAKIKKVPNEPSINKSIKNQVVP